MLQTLSITDFALIERQQLDFKEGLTVISGETGAGKSILIDAFALLLGKRANREMIREGCDKAIVEALFYGPEKYIEPNLLTELGFENDSELILSREIRTDGRSYARVNGRLVTLNLLSELSSKLIAIHGQNSQEEIYHPPAQLKLLDKFAGPEHQAALKAWEAGVMIRRELVSELKQLGLSPRERSRELELLEYQIAELTEAQLEAGEDENLERKHKKLSALSKINQDLDQFEALFSTAEDGGIRTNLQAALKALEYPARFSKKLSNLRSEVLLMSENAREIAYSLSDLRSQLAIDSESAAEISERLEEINELKRKYGDTLDDIFAFLEQAQTREAYLKNSEQRFAELQAELKKVEADLCTKAEVLSRERKRTAERFAEAMQASLVDLNLPKARFAVRISAAETKAFPLSGRDELEFLFSANEGESLKALAKVASGGEASRLILAIKSILADQAEIPVLIFDEIDQGIGGRTAAKVAQRLHSLSRERQVFCVTHSASIAAQADTHFLLEKSFSAGRTKTSSIELKAEARLNEVARLLSGAEAPAESLALAQRLLNQDEINYSD
ncbi:MAG: DNA repair protein RecN [Eubacteriales bacterium]|nr:DNA repair protein RecN [Eubacteriales bacterium]